MANMSSMGRSVDSALWQDYRASNTAMVVFYSTDPVSEIPIREVPEEYPSDILPEPNYESATYGFYGCSRSKIRTAFVKSKLRYVIFVTKYQGTNADYKDRFFVTGYIKVNKIADVKKAHIRFCSDFTCLDEPRCLALRGDEQRFVSIEEAFEVTPDVLLSWDFKAKLTRQARIILNEENTMKIIEHLDSKNDITEKYIEETARLQPHSDDEESE